MMICLFDGIALIGGIVCLINVWHHWAVARYLSGVIVSVETGRTRLSAAGGMALLRNDREAEFDGASVNGLLAVLLAWAISDRDLGDRSIDMAVALVMLGIVVRIRMRSATQARRRQSVIDGSEE